MVNIDTVVTELRLKTVMHIDTVGAFFYAIAIEAAFAEGGMEDEVAVLLLPGVMGVFAVNISEISGDAGVGDF